jgi:RecB family exonuclease
MLAEARYLGGVGRLEQLAREWTIAAARPALDVALDVARELTSLAEDAPASARLERFWNFLTARLRPIGDDEPFRGRERRARAAILEILAAGAHAHQAHHDPIWTFAELAAAVRRWVGEGTFRFDSPEGGIQLLDDQTARFGAFDDITIVGLVANDWPERPHRNIFYPRRLLTALGWPTEKDRRAASDAQLLDLLSSATRRVCVSTFAVDDDAIVMRSTQLDVVSLARLTSLADDCDYRTPVLRDDKLTSDSPDPRQLPGGSPGWLEMRAARSGFEAGVYHGTVGAIRPQSWSTSALETYLACPFKFFAQHVLRLSEEPEDEEVMAPRRQGRFVHAVFEMFFEEWQAAGRNAVTDRNLSEARAVFAAVVDRALADLPDHEAAFERTRLLGSSAAMGLGESVLRMEAEQPTAVVGRLLEYRMAGEFKIATNRGARVVSLKGVADRIDLLEDGTFRLIDYKLGWPPNRARALQLPIYGVCAEQRLSAETGRWRLGQAVYLAFKGPRRVVPLFRSAESRDEVLADAQQRLADTLDGIERGEFPPRPDDVYRCETCRFSAVCRKDYA